MTANTKQKLLLTAARRRPTLNTIGEPASNRVSASHFRESARTHVTFGRRVRFQCGAPFFLRLVEGISLFELLFLSPRAQPEQQFTYTTNGPPPNGVGRNTNPILECHCVRLYREDGGKLVYTPVGLTTVTTRPRCQRFPFLLATAYTRRKDGDTLICATLVTIATAPSHANALLPGQSANTSTCSVLGCFHRPITQREQMKGERKKGEKHTYAKNSDIVFFLAVAK